MNAHGNNGLDVYRILKKKLIYYFNSSGGYVGDFNYPRKFHFDCDASWIQDISLCITQPRGGGIVRPD